MSTGQSKFGKSGALKVFKRQWLPFTANAVGTATTALYDDGALLLSGLIGFGPAQDP